MLSKSRKPLCLLTGFVPAFADQRGFPDLGGAPCAPDSQIGTLLPVIASLPPIALLEIELRQIDETPAYARIIGPPRLPGMSRDRFQSDSTSAARPGQA